LIISQNEKGEKQMIMSYKEFTDKLDKKIVVGHELYLQLLKAIIASPNRYTGIFRVSSAKTKLIQNVTQSNEIKFGDFLEDVVTEYIARLGFTNLPKVTNSPVPGEGTLLFDQLFTDQSGVIYIVEQKIRDDHDSTKKVGQFGNFILKIDRVKLKYPNRRIVATMWFIDDSLRKNFRYYLGEMKKKSISNCELHIYYGSGMFANILKSEKAWDEICDYLLRNKVNRSNEILHIPDFDTSNEILIALQELDYSEKRKLLSSNDEYVQLRKELFPTGYNLKKMK
jgi:hypothetical protein